MIQTAIVAGQQPKIGNSVDISSGLGLPSYDHIDITYPSDTTEHYVFKKSGSQVAVIDLTYSDATKANLITVQKS